MEKIRYFDRYTKQYEEEQVMGEHFLKWIYGSTLGKVALHTLIKRRFFSDIMGWWMNRAGSIKSIPPFIDQYQIDMNESIKQVGDFTCFNDFFARKLTPEARPILGDEMTAVFPADARHMGWQDAALIENVFVKNQSFDLTALLDSVELAQKYAHGTLILSRLCPVDYHRFHFPVAGIPSTTRRVSGSLASVSPYCLRNKLAWLWTNKRTITELKSEQWGDVLLIEVGATGVGAIHETYTPNKPVEKGAEKGYFTFGGSTVITIFEPNKIQLAPDLLANTAERTELYAKQGDIMGILQK